MKGTTKIGLGLALVSLMAGVFYFMQFALAPTITWTSDSDWSGGTHTNATSINGDLMLNNTIVNGTQTIYSWFYNGWTYRRQIIVNGSTALLNDYSIMINLTNRTAGTDNFDFSKAISDGNDTRITWLNASSGMEQNVSFWIENWTSSGKLGNATIWVKVPNITAQNVANTTLYMYYGNTTAVNTVSNGNNTFDFFDDFSSGLGKWTVLIGSWSIDSNGVVQQTNNAGEFWQTGLRVTNPITADGRAVAMKIRLDDTSGDRYAAFTGKWNDATEGLSDGHHLHISLNKEASPLLKVIAQNNGWKTNYQAAITINYNTWYVVEARITNAGKVEIYIDGKKYLSFTDADWDQTWQYINLLTFNSKASFDDVRVRNYTSPEPSVLSVGAEQTARNKGTYLSNTTTTAAIVSITPIWNATNSTNVNFTVDISANGGSSWCGNVANNTAYTSANNCGGIGSGNQLVYRVNFSTNDTNMTAILSNINLNLNVSINQWSANSTKLSSPQTYNPGITYGFQINWSSSTNTFANATFQLGRPSGTFTNYTNSSAIKTQYVSGDNYTGNARWYINFTQDQFGPVGTYNFTWFGIDKYGMENNSDTINYVISQNSSAIVSLFINNSQSDRTIYSPNITNLTASVNVNGYAVGIDANFSGVIQQIASGTTPATNFTNLSNLAKGVYNITAYLLPGQNYTGTPQTYYLTVRGRLNITIDAPGSNAIFNRTYPYMLNSTVRDDNGIVSGANVSWFASEAFLNSSTGTYNYTWTVPASQVIGLTTMKVNATKTYYDFGENTTTVQVWRNLTVNLTLSQQSIYRNNSYNPYNSSFLTYVSDESGAVSGVTVTYYRNGTQLQSRDTTASGYADNPNNYTYNPADTTTPASYLIAVNITSAHSNTYFTNNSGILTVNAFLNSTITQPGNGAYFHKNETMALQSQTKDDNNNLISPDSINWTLNGVQILSAETGSYEIPRNHSSGNSFPLNITSSKPFYGTSAYQISIEIWSWLINISSPANNTLIHKTDTLQLNSTVRDEKSPNNIVNYNVSWKINNTEIAGGNVTSWTAPNSQALGYYVLNANTTNATYQVGNSTGIYVFGWSNITNLTGIGTYPAGTIAEITCSVRDANNSAAVQDYPVRFYKNDTLQATNYTNITGTARWFWDTSSDNNPYDIKCNITDNSTLYYNVSFPQITAQSNVTKILNLVEISVDNTTIYRKDTCSGCSPFATNFTVHITEAQLGNSNGATVRVYNSTNMIGSCLTNSTGWCAVTYNAHHTISPNNYTIWVNATKSDFVDSTTNQTWVVVKGKLNAWIDDPYGGEKWYRTQSVNMYSTVQDENSAAVAATVEWQNASGNAIATGEDATWQISAGYPLGQVPLRVNATKNYYDNYTSPTATVEIYGRSNVSWISPSGIQRFGDILALNCSVRDANNSLLVNDYIVNFYRNNTLIGNNTTAGGFSAVYWSPSLADYSVRCNITNNATLYYDVSVSQSNQSLSIRDLTKPYIRNATLLYGSVEPDMNQTIRTNITDDVAIDKVWAAIDVPPQNDTDNPSYFNITMDLTDGNSTVAYYEVNYTPQKGGIYNVTIFANDTSGNINSTLAGNFSSPKNTTGYVNQIAYEIVADVNSTYNRSLRLNATLVNTGNTSMNTASITITLPSGWNSGNTTISCGSVTKLTNCTQIFNISVPAGTAPANYTISTEGKWRNPDNTLAYFGNYPTNQTVINITDNPMLNITANSSSGTVGHGNESAVGTFVLQAIGNAQLSQIYFNRTSGNLSANWVEFEVAGTSNINYLP